MITVRNLRKTCNAMPAQWIADADEGLGEVVIHFRHGWLSVWFDQQDEFTILSREVRPGQMGEGEMEESEMRELTAGALKFE